MYKDKQAEKKPSIQDVKEIKDAHLSSKHSETEKGQRSNSIPGSPLLVIRVSK